MIKKINILGIAFLSLFMFSCNKFLDDTPDNRALVDSKSKIQKLLVSAYPANTYAMVTELSSDNVLDMGEANPNTKRFYEQVSYWKDITEVDNDDTKSLWEGCYGAIANANQALSAIEELGEESLKAEKAEALVARAYAHFILVNVFCKNYNSSTSDTDLGIPYMKRSETTLDPKYKRGTVKEVYEQINADLEEALPFIDDNIYQVTSYHFNQRAAYAFAARFNLYYERWDKAKEYASKVVGNNPLGVLRGWEALGSLPKRPDPVTNAYINESSDLLVQPSGSAMGLVFGAYYYGSRFNHARLIADQQTLFAPTPWSKSSPVKREDFNFEPFVYTANNLDKTLSYKLPYLFEVTDPVANIGFWKTVMVPFSTDETLLVKAEAEVMLGNLDEAMKDLNVWSSNFYKNKTTTIEEVNDFYNNMEYSSDDNITQKKKLSPAFTIGSKEQENMIHYLLQCRRVLTLHEGLRWFDIKRYGIEVRRIQYLSNGTDTEIRETLPVGDPRRAIQIPADVVSAGLEPNPR